MTITYIVLKETTVLYILWLIIRRKNVHIFHIENYLNVSNAYLFRFAKTLHDKGWAHIVPWSDRKSVPYDTISKEIPYNNLAVVIQSTDIFRESEAWQEKHFEYEMAHKKLGLYALPYFDITGNYIQKKYCLIYNIQAILTGNAAREFKIVGVSKDTWEFYNHRFKEPVVGLNPPSLNIGQYVNILSAIALLIFALGWTLSRTRPFFKTSKSYFLGCDYMGDKREKMLWDELSDAPGSILAVFRNKLIRKQYKNSGIDRETCIPTDGLFNVADSCRAYKLCFVETLKICRYYLRLDPSLFRQLASLPFKRVIFKAFFSRRKFKYYWSRDDYNVEHIIRSQELRNLGAKSIGIMHGISGISPVLQQIRHVDYDLYYVFHETLTRKFYGSKWPNWMELKAIGSFGITRAEFHKMGLKRTSDIFCVLSWSTDPWQVFDAISTLAKNFPDRTVIVTTKPRQRNGPYGKKLDKFLQSCPSNVEEFHGNTYELFYRCSYMVSEMSTLVLEAIHFGLYAFTLDLKPRMKALNLRNMPNLCLTSNDEAVDRIQSIEDGSWKYPRHLYKENVEMTGRVVWDIIREDMGLQAKEGPVPHLILDNLPT